ncbi:MULTISPECIES: GT4 family glycosyltransferase PelF [Paenibacillus]|uniref:GT4 family glycosyltransferase PelF n=1 Tax=Paenibacillus TaxID=44249 RepID=UPI0022B898E3|nr:GT4 family glycosyltransferase PelF [Paenibacillus caseinilyticus]MCZ8519012.1 GT4 family glycosyltransferase PelF [Paenibacillus caseinilyticus]
MKIALIVEGSYPYVYGGVASWVQMLVTTLREHEFEIIAISSSRREIGEPQYKMPVNVSGVHDVFIMDYLDLTEGRGPRLSREEARLCLDWFAFKEGSEGALPVIADPARLGNPISFLKSEAFWDLLVESYRQEMPTKSFNAYFWTWRSMYLPAIFLLQQEYPQADVYHAVSTGYAGLIASFLRQKHGTPFLLTEHGVYAREREEEILQSAWVEPGFKQRWIDYFYHLSQGAYRTADRTIALYGGTQNIQRDLGVPAERSLIVPNGVDYEPLSQLPCRSSEPGMTIVFAAIVRLVPIKDVKTLLYAARLASRQIPDMELWIMGPTDEDPDYYRECLALAKHLGLEAIVTFTGKVRIAERLPQVDVLLLSSISEGQPLAVLEGMAAGIPWICTDVGSCRELLEGRDEHDAGIAGYVVPPVNPAAMAQRMVQLYEYPEERSYMGQVGRRRVEANYQIGHFIGMYRKLYREAVDGWPE